MRAGLRRSLCLTLAAATFTAYATPLDPTGEDSSFKIQWASCGDASPPGLDCGQLQVPLDWSRPDGERISLGIMKLNATSKKGRIGSLMLNPGGPGGAATSFCEAQAAGTPFFSTPLTEHFDIICPDPRGIGTSSPISCDPDLWNKRPSLFPTDAASFDRIARAAEAFGQSCLDMSGALVKHVDTISVARDIEAIRVALNDGKLNWLGISYGTQIGSQYASLYPDNIRAMVLDGNVDHTSPELYTTNAEMATYENELQRFFDWCGKTASCDFPASDIPGAFDKLVTRANGDPIAAPGCLAAAKTQSTRTCRGNVTGEDILFNVQGNGLLTNKLDTTTSSGWEALGQALNESAHGNATLLSSQWAADENSTAWQGLLVGCLDWDHSFDTFALNQRRQLLGNATAPHTRGASQSYQYNTQCIGWPFPAQNPPNSLASEALARAPPILMVNSNHDPESSYVWAQRLAAQIPSAVLITRDGDGHGSYGHEGEAQALMEAYLVNKTLPAKDTVVSS